jgi:hypothetical protein
MSAAGALDVRVLPIQGGLTSGLAPLPPPVPRLREIVGRISTNLLVACVVPAVLISIAVAVADVYAAIVAALVWTVAATCWRCANRQRPSTLLVLTATILVVRTAVTLATGNTFIYFVQPVFANAGVALVFIASLATSTPIVARLAADFYPMSADISARPRVRRLLWQLTLLWGLVCLAKGMVTLWLLTSRSEADFVMAKNVVITAMTGLTVAVTIGLSARVARLEGLLGSA